MSRSAIFTARTTAYGCAPGGDTTVFLETTDGRPLASIKIFVKPPDLNISPNPIDIGQSATITATNVFNVGGRIKFEINSPADFNQSCTDASSSLIESPPVIVSGNTATKDLFGCSPGGTAIVTLKKIDGTFLNSTTVTVNPPSSPVPTGRLTVGPATIDIGDATYIVVDGLENTRCRRAFGI